MKPKLGIVSTYDEFCGIAAYTRALVKQLENDFDITVLELDQYLLKSKHPRVQILGDRHIKRMASELKKFDFVNIQLEHGTFGNTPKRILKRFRWIVRSAPHVSVTFHTILLADSFDWKHFIKSLVTLRFGSGIRQILSNKRDNMLSSGVNQILRREARSKIVKCLTHTRRDMRLLRDVYRLPYILDHPLSFLPQESRHKIWEHANRDVFPIASTLPGDVKVIGVFGFISEYKGIDTVIRALYHLPSNYHLLVFGGIHPATIKKYVPIDKYINKLFSEAYVDKSIYDKLIERFSGSGNVSFTLSGAPEDVSKKHPKDLSERVHFMGALRDDQFLDAMAICDAVVMPYIEVGQSASGPIAQATELGCRVLASRTHAFMQFARYHQNAIEFFDIGNYLQLAEIIRAQPPFDPKKRHLKYNTDTNREIYRKLNSLER